MHPHVMSPQERSRTYSRRIAASLLGIACFHVLLYADQYKKALDDYTTYSDLERLSNRVTNDVEICRSLTHRIAGFGYCLAAEEFYINHYQLKK